MFNFWEMHPETDLSACSHRKLNPNNSNFHESGILKKIPLFEKIAGMRKILKGCYGSIGKVT